MQETTATYESNSARKRRIAKEFNAAGTSPCGKSIATLSSTEKAELNALSKEVFGATSRWQKLVNDGYSRLLTEKVQELVPSEKEGQEGRTVESDAPVKRADGAYQSVLTRHTVESIRTYMAERKAQLDSIRAAMKKNYDDAQAQKAKEALAMKIHEELQGSAL